MSEFYTILFKSRNKDNKNIQHFNQRSQTFLSDAPIETLNNQFDAFVEAGRHAAGKLGDKVTEFRIL